MNRLLRRLSSSVNDGIALASVFIVSSELMSTFSATKTLTLDSDIANRYIIQDTTSMQLNLCYCCSITAYSAFCLASDGFLEQYFRTADLLDKISSEHLNIIHFRLFVLLYCSSALIAVVLELALHISTTSDFIVMPLFG